MVRFLRYLAQLSVYLAQLSVKYQSYNKMGNDEAKSADAKRIRFEEMFHKNFDFVEERMHEMFGQIEVFSNKNTGKFQVIVKNLSYVQQQELQKLIHTLRERVINPIPNLLSIYHIEEIKITNAFCGSALHLKIYIEFLERSLKEEMRRRRKHKNYYFSEEQLWKIAISLVNALKHLHELQQFHGEIRLENILIDKEYHMKLVDRSLLNSFNWEIALQQENVTLIKGRGILFSPCILKCLSNKKTQIVSYDPFKADVWAVGMIMLECCSQKKAEDFYDYELFTVKFKEIQFTIYEMRKRYSWQFMNLVEKMLQEDDDDRPSALEIYEKIRKIPNETIRQLNMTLNESFMNQSIRSYM